MVARGLTVEDLAAMTASLNILSLIWFSGTGLSNIFRTRLNLLLGMRKFRTARNFAFWFFKATLLFSLVFQMFFYSVKGFICDLSASNHGIYQKMDLQLTIYALTLWIDIVLIMVMVAARSIGFVSFAFKLYVMFVPCSLLLSYISVFVLQVGIWGILVFYLLG